jgi:hypothetical protein
MVTSAETFEEMKGCSLNFKIIMSGAVIVYCRQIVCSIILVDVLV